MSLQIVECLQYNYTGVLGEPTTVTDGWLSIQSKPYARDAVFYSMYPLEGGACIVDINNIKYLGEPSEKQYEQLKNGELCFSATNTILKLMNAKD